MGIRRTVKSAFNFLVAWAQELPNSIRRNNHNLLFGIRNRLVVFVVMLIALALFLSEQKTRTTLNYVVNRERVDLADESLNAKLDMELALQTAYSQLISDQFKVVDESNSNSHEIELTPLDPKKGIQHARFIRSLSLDHVDELDHFGQLELDKLKASFLAPTGRRASAPCWSQVFWETTETETNSSKLFMELLIPLEQISHYQITNNSTSADSLAEEPVALDIPRKNSFWLVRLDLTKMFDGLTDKSRILSYFADAQGKLLLQPNGSHDPVAGAKMPKHVDHALAEFPIKDPKKNSGLSSDGVAGFWGISGASVGGMVAHSTEADFELLYSETVNLDDSIYEQLDSSDLERIEATLRSEDPFVRVDEINPLVGEVRIRASDPDSLKLTKGFVERSIRKINKHLTTIEWTDVSMDDFVLSVQAVQLPTTGGEGTQYLGQLVRASSISEIERSASHDLDKLHWYTSYAIIVSLALTWLVASYLVNPLARMTNVAQKLSETGFKIEGDQGKQIEMLLTELPLDRRDEIGVLAKQFEKTSRDLIKANMEVNEKAKEAINKQRLLERIEREKAVTSKLSEDRFRLLATVSHDMRQPLHPIFQHADKLLSDSKLDDEQYERVETIANNAHQLEYLIEEILDHHRILSGKVQLSNEAFEMDQMLVDLKELFDGKLKDRNIKLNVSNHWSGTMVSDKSRLNRVLANLISNAIRATHNGEINLQVSPLGVDHLEISVSDTGRGMDEFQKRLVFQSPERQAEIRGTHSNLDNKDSNSTGLGTFNAKQLMMLMGGDIRFESEEGRGTKFVIKLPIKPPVSPINTTTAKTGSTNHRNLVIDAVTAGSKVLIVDDDPRCAEILKELLHELGCTTWLAHDGPSALVQAESLQPDLITLDVLMPDMDGWETLRRLKSRRETERIPVVMVTVSPDETQAMILGASGVVAKPIDSQDFNRAVKAAIGERTGTQVLLVDDDQQCLSQLESMLKPLACRVITAENGLEALEKIEHLDPPLDLAIVDLYMPDMDGFELIGKLCQMPETEHIPIIVLSAGLLSETEIADLQPHVTKFFSKGAVNFATLRNEIRRLLSQSEKARQGNYQGTFNR